MNPGRAFGIVRLRLRSLFRRSAVERELGRELQFHLEQQKAENLTRGFDDDFARTMALRSMGGITNIAEECRDMRRTNHIENFVSDLKYAVRTLRGAPGFTVVILLTLALSVGATTAIFSVIEGVLLRPLPFRQPDRLVRIFFNSDSYAKFPLNPFDFQDFRARNRTFEGLAAITRRDLSLSGAGAPVMLHGFQVTSGYFELLGFRPAMGRELTVNDELPNASNVAVLSERLWRSRFAADPKIVGKRIVLGAAPYTVVGVMPPGVQHPGNEYHAVADGETVDIWYALRFRGDPNHRGSHYIEGIGRLRPGVTVAQANADLTGVLHQLMDSKVTGKGWRILLVPLFVEVVGRTQRMLYVLSAAVGLLLLIACVNAANLLLARATARQREMAVRASLGASRGRMIRQLLTESLLIAVVGAGLGGALAVAGERALVALLPPAFPRAGSIHLDVGVFSFTLLIAVLTGLLFGIVPALTISNMDPQQNLKAGGRGTAGSRGHAALRNVLVAGETGLACVLLIGAGLMLHSFINLLRSDPGFQPDNGLTAAVELNGDYKTVEDIQRFYRRLTSSLEVLPGVKAVGVGTDVPFSGYDENEGGFLVEGRTSEYSDKTTARYHVATLDYFKALGTPLLRGRWFTESDNAQAPAVLLVNETMARRYWPGEEAIGKRVAFTDMPAEKDWMRIVGVVADVKDEPDQPGAHPSFWWPMEQMPGTYGGMSLVMRSSLAPTDAANQVRLAVRRLDPALAVSDVKSLGEIADSSVSTHRFALFLIGLFAALALILASIGMYGVIAYSVNLRMPEFGVRMALGAQPGQLIGLILGEGVRLSVLGAVAGMVTGVALTRLLRSLLYEVGPSDPATLIGVPVLAIVTAVVASYVPARRAAGADPMKALRSE